MAAVKEKIASMQHAAYCFDMLVQELTEQASQFDWSSLPLGHAKMPVFVTWYKRSARKKYDELRGCLGTFSQELPISIGLKKYSVMSALNDKRFDPISSSEVASLSCSVSLLHSFVRAKSWNDWELGKHGITIHFTDSSSSSSSSSSHRKSYNATYLPEVPGQQRWNKLVTIENLVAKAGFRGRASAVKNLSVTKYQSCKYSAEWADFVRFTAAHHVKLPAAIASLSEQEEETETELTEEEEQKTSKKEALSSSSSLRSIKSRNENEQEEEEDEEDEEFGRKKRERNKRSQSRSRSRSRSRTRSVSSSASEDDYDSQEYEESDENVHSAHKQLTKHRKSDDGDAQEDEEEEEDKEEEVKIKRNEQMSFDEYQQVDMR